MPYLRPDSKAQFTVEFSAIHRPERIHTIVLSTQHDEFDTDERMHARIEKDVREIVIPRLIASLPERTARLFDDRFILHVNPTGKFVIGGPAGDTGLTGRKIIVDTYGGRGPTEAEPSPARTLQSRPLGSLRRPPHSQEPRRGGSRRGMPWSRWPTPSGWPAR